MIRSGQHPALASPSPVEERLLVLEPARQQHGLQSLLLQGDKYLVGSDSECAFRIDASGVQPRHCLILPGPKGPILKAWDNRTWLNDRPVKEAGLREGDRLVVGPIELRIRRALPDDLARYIQTPEPESRHQDSAPVATTAAPDSAVRATAATAPAPTGVTTPARSTPRTAASRPATAEPVDHSSAADPQPAASDSAPRKTASAAAVPSPAVPSAAVPSEAFSSATARTSPNSTQGTPSPRAEATPRPVPVTPLVTAQTVVDPPALPHPPGIEPYFADVVDLPLSGSREQRLLAEIGELHERLNRSQAARSRQVLQTRLRRESARLAMCDAERLAEELRQREETLQSEQQQLRREAQRLAERIADQEAALQASVQETRQQYEELVAREDTLRQREADLETQAAQLQSTRALAEEVRQRTDRKRNVVADLAEELLRSQSEMEAQRKAISHDRRTVDDATRQLAQQRQELEQRAGEIDRRQCEIAVRESTVQSRAQDIDLRQKQIAERERLAAQQQSEAAETLSRLQTQQQALSAREQELTARETELERHQQQVQQAEAELALRQQQFQQQSDLLAQQQQSAARQRTMLEDWQRGITEHEAELGRWDQELQGREDELQQRANQLETATAAHAHERTLHAQQLADLDTNQQGLLSRSTELDQAETALRQQQADLQARETALQLRQDELASQRDQWQQDQAAIELRARDQSAVALRLSQREAAIAEQEQSLREQAEELARQQAAAAAREQQLAEQERAARETEQQLLSREESLRAREAGVQPLEERANAERLDVEQAKSELRQRELELEALADRLQSQADEIEQQRISLQQEIDAFAAQRRDVATTTQQQADRSKELEQHAASVAALSQQFETDQQLLAALKEELHDRTQRLADRESEIEARERHATDRAREAAEELQRLQDWEQRLRTEAESAVEPAADDLHMPSSELDARQQELARREQDVADRAAELESLEEALTARNAALEQQQQELESRRQHLNSIAALLAPEQPAMDESTQSAESDARSDLPQPSLDSTEADAGPSGLKSTEDRSVAESSGADDLDSPPVAAGDVIPTLERESLETLSQDLDHKARELAALQQEWETRQAELDAREQQLQQERERLAEHRHGLDADADHLRAAQETVEQRLEEVEQRWQQIDEMLQQLLERELELNRERQRLEEQAIAQVDRSDTQTVDRTVPPELQATDLSGADLPEVDLPVADLQEADLPGGECTALADAALTEEATPPADSVLSDDLTLPDNAAIDATAEVGSPSELSECSDSEPQSERQAAEPVLAGIETPQEPRPQSDAHFEIEPIPDADSISQELLAEAAEPPSNSELAELPAQSEVDQNAAAAELSEPAAAESEPAGNFPAADLDVDTGSDLADAMRVDPLAAVQDIEQLLASVQETDDASDEPDFVNEQPSALDAARSEIASPDVTPVEYSEAEPLSPSATTTASILAEDPSAPAARAMSDAAPSQQVIGDEAGLIRDADSISDLDSISGPGNINEPAADHIAEQTAVDEIDPLVSEEMTETTRLPLTDHAAPVSGPHATLAESNASGPDGSIQERFSNSEYTPDGTHATLEASQPSIACLEREPEPSDQTEPVPSISELKIERSEEPLLARQFGDEVLADEQFERQAEAGPPFQFTDDFARQLGLLGGGQAAARESHSHRYPSNIDRVMPVDRVLPIDYESQFEGVPSEPESTEAETVAELDPQTTPSLTDDLHASVSDSCGDGASAEPVSGQAETDSGDEPSELSEVERSQQLCPDAAPVEDQTLKLRSLLSDMFGIADLGKGTPRESLDDHSDTQAGAPDDLNGSATEQDPEAELTESTPEAAPETEPESGRPAYQSAFQIGEEASPDIEDEELQRLQASLTDLIAEVESAGTPEKEAPAVQAAAAPEAVAEEPAPDAEESIASYMEKLLARNRRGNTSHLTTKESPSEMSRAGATVALPCEKVDLDKVDLPEAADTESDTPRVPRAKPNVNEIRERNLPLRAVANLSARSALARFARKRHRENLIFKSATAGISAVVLGSMLKDLLFNMQSIGFMQVVTGILVSIVGISAGREAFTLKKKMHTPKAPIEEK